MFLQIPETKRDMMILKLLLSSGLTVIAAMAFFTDNQTINLFKQDVYVQSVYVISKHYDIKLRLYIEENISFGNCNISIKIFRPTQHIKLYSKVKYITDVTVIDDPPIFPVHDTEMIVYKPVKSLYDNQMHIAEYFFMNELSSGHYILNIKFIDIIADNTGLTGFYKTKNLW